MSLNAISEIREAEMAADQSRVEARGQAQQMIADAERRGRQLLEQRQAQSASEAAEAMKQAEAAAEQRRSEILAEARSEGETLKAQAQSNMARAVKAITERVVES